MTIEVSSGTYHENVVVNKTVQLRGENPATTIIDGGGAGNTTVVTTDNVTVTGFTITNGINGLLLEEVEGCKISANRITHSLYGLLLQDCSNNTLDNNTLLDNEYGFGVKGSELSHYMNSIENSNTISGKPILYLTNRNGYTINSQSPAVGFLAFINSTDINIQNVTEEHNYQGILLAYTHGSLVKNVTFKNNIIGLELQSSSNNTIFHNSFVNNTVHAKTYGSYDNLWDEGYPKGGNYWDSYANVDEKNGPHQDVPGSDGIGDAPWIIDENSVDNYPLMNLANADQIPPITHDDYDGLWHAQGFVITLTATDVWSGVAETYYKINGGLTQIVSADGQPHINDAGASNTLEYWSMDNAGNEELPHKMLANIKCDGSAPTGSITIKDSDVYATSRSVVLTLTAIDNESGVSQVRYSNDGVWDSEPWTSPSQTELWNLTLGDGTKTVYFQIKNNAGLLSLTYSDTIILDTSQPLIETPTRVPAGDVQSNQSVTISANISDAVSGVKNATLYYSTDGGTTWTGLPMNHDNLTGFYDTTIQEQESGTWVEYKIEAYDRAGNSVMFDQTEPYYVSQSVPAFPSIIVALLFLSLVLVVFALIKRKNR
jgi:parallel beta-helix repeat protein